MDRGELNGRKSAARVCLLAALLIGTLILTSCGPGTERAEPPDAWVVAPTRVGPVEVGATLAAALPLMAAGTDAAALGEGCAYVTARGAPHGVRFMVEGGRIVRVDVTEGATATVEGARVGDSERRILELYPAARRTPHKYEEGSFYLVVLAADDTLSRYLFETNGAAVTRYRAGLFPQVEYVEGCG